jgi:hypothetical protein
MWCTAQLHDFMKNLSWGILHNGMFCDAMHNDQTIIVCVENSWLCTAQWPVFLENLSCGVLHNDMFFDEYFMRGFAQWREVLLFA